MTTQKVNCNTDKSKRARHWTFTCFDYDDEKIAQLHSVSEKIMFQEETTKDGKKHLQGLMSFKNGKTFSAVKKLMGNDHIEICKSVKASIKYCSKEESKVEGGISYNKGYKNRINVGDDVWYRRNFRVYSAYNNMLHKKDMGTINNYGIKMLKKIGRKYYDALIMNDYDDEDEWFMYMLKKRAVEIDSDNEE